MAERFNAPVLKIGDGKPSVGSNPTLSVYYKMKQLKYQITLQTRDKVRKNAYVKINGNDRTVIEEAIWKPVINKVHRTKLNVIETLEKQ